MKWFKHDSTALHDAKIEKLVMQYGMEGYGLYFACLEMIAGGLAPGNATFELEHDVELLAYKFRMDNGRVEDIMKACVRLGLFTMNPCTGHLVCLKLGKRLDDTMSRNPEIRKIIEEYQKQLATSSPEETSENPEETSENPEESRSSSDQTRLDESRLDKKKTPSAGADTGATNKPMEREAQKSIPDNVTPMSQPCHDVLQNCHTEIETEIEIEKDRTPPAGTDGNATNNESAKPKEPSGLSGNPVKPSGIELTDKKEGEAKTVIDRHLELGVIPTGTTGKDITSKEPSLHQRIIDACRGVHGEDFASYGKEGASAKRLLKKAEQRAGKEAITAEEWLSGYMKAAHRLWRSEEFWSKQPFSPTLVNSSAFFDRVMKTARESVVSDDLAEFAEELFK